MPSSHLIFCHPLILLLPIPPSIRVFSNESIHRMRWTKYWSFSFSISPSNETLTFGVNVQNYSRSRHLHKAPDCLIPISNKRAGSSSGKQDTIHLRSQVRNFGVFFNLSLSFSNTTPSIPYHSHPGSYLIPHQVLLTLSPKQISKIYFILSIFLVTT